MYDRILGGLIGAGAGDAMGAATEARTTEQILAYFGHEVTDFETPPMDTFGAGLHVSEAIPSAFGLFAANEGDALGSIVGAVNVGYDTDTIATMSGALSGALNGAGAFPPHFLPTLQEANHLEIERLAKDLTAIAQDRLRAQEKGGARHE